MSLGKQIKNKSIKASFKMEERPEPWIEAVRAFLFSPGENQIYEEAKEKVVRKTL